MNNNNNNDNNRQAGEISHHEKTCTWIRNGNFKREIESLLIAAQKQFYKINYIKAKIDKRQQNNKCRLCGDADETINYIMSESSKLALKEYKTRHDWAGKVINGEFCKKLKFDHTVYALTRIPLRE